MQAIQFRLCIIRNYELKGCGGKRKFGGTTKNHEKLKNSWSLNGDWNAGPTDMK